MKRYIKAFTLVELIVWITMSMLLMLAVSIFVGNWIKNITNQKTSLENDTKVKDFTKVVYENLSSLDKYFWVINVNSWVLFKVNKNYDRGGFSFIWSGSFLNYYCLSWSENWKEITSHIFLKTFLPFEWESWDIFNIANWNFNSGWINTNMFSWIIIKWWISTWILVWPTDVVFNWPTGFVADTLWHSIYSFNIWTLNNFKKLVWKEVFWNEFSDWDYWTGVFLNNPTWLEYALIWWTGFLFISDTLNDRILYQNLWDNKIYKLLWREDGLKEPTWIYYNASSSTLYIANSGKKQILSYSSSWSFVSNVNLNFTPKNDISWINKFEFSFLYASWVINPTITTTINTWSFSFINITSWEDLYEIWTSNTWTYHFVNYSVIDTLQAWCVAGQYQIIAWNPIKCTNAWTWRIWTYQNKNFTWWNNYQISISGVWPQANFSNTWAYYVGLKLLSWSIIKKSYYFPYFSVWDNNFFTKNDNILKILTWGLWYPTWIYWSWSNLVYNDFLSRKRIEITKTWSFVSSTNLNAFDFSALNINSTNDSILYTPVKNYDFTFVNNLLNIYINYYKNFSCYSDENQNQLRELILKKSF